MEIRLRATVETKVFVFIPICKEILGEAHRDGGFSSCTVSQDYNFVQKWGYFAKFDKDENKRIRIEDIRHTERFNLQSCLQFFATRFLLGIRHTKSAYKGRFGPLLFSIKKKPWLDWRQYAVAHIRSENTSGTDFSEQPYPRKRMRSTRTRVQVLCSTFYHKKGPSRLRLGMICEYLFCRVSIRLAHAGNWIAVLELNSRTVHLAVRVQLCTVRVSKVVRRSYNFIISIIWR
jgi:hypothetical protein